MHHLQLNDLRPSCCASCLYHLTKYGWEAIKLQVGLLWHLPMQYGPCGLWWIQLLIMTLQVNSVISSCNYHIRQIGRIRKVICCKACQAAAILSLVTSRLDSCNILLTQLQPTGLTAEGAKLDSSTGDVCQQVCCITPTFFSWSCIGCMPVCQRIKYKVLPCFFQGNS